MTDDHDWVARLLAASVPPGIPDDVALRLDRALVEATAQGRSVATPTGSVPTATATPTAPAATTSAPAVASAQTVPATTVTTLPPPGTVPPAASTETTGALPRLRSVPTVSAEDPAEPDRTRRDDTATIVPVSRTGSSRREQRQDDLGERRRRRLTRWAPVAAGILLLGGAAVAVVDVMGFGDSTSSSGASDAAAGAAAESAAAPRVLVATGTKYATTDVPAFETQVLQLVATVAGGDPAVAAADPQLEAAESRSTAADSSAVADPLSAETSPLADPQVLADCVAEVTDGATTTAAAVDLAVVDGLASTVLVVPDAAGLTYQVYVVGAGCGDIDTRLRFFTVTP